MMMLMMEGAEQDYEEGFFGYKDHQSQMMIMKGKRTKRQRLNSPLAALATTASSSSSAGHEDQEHHQEHQEGLVFGPTARGISVSSDVGPAASPPTSADQSNTESSTEEEEDMANCLILLAQGKSTPQPQYPKLVINNNKASVLPAAAAGSYVYKCKTCDRCFHSFQALGGHRASHKKEKNINHTQENNRKALSFVEEAEEIDRYNSTTLSLQISNRDYRSLSSAATTVCHSNNKANKVHECSVCGAEFTSGQALGGHMRRHRTFNSTTTAAVNMSPPQSQSVGSKRPRDMLQLDLNLPAPEEERVDTKFPFGSKKEQVIVFSASPLVGCHY